MFGRNPPLSPERFIPRILGGSKFMVTCLFVCLFLHCSICISVKKKSRNVKFITYYYRAYIQDDVF